jgi:copper chaperone CopZ
VRVALKQVEGLAEIKVSLQEGEAKITFQPQNRTSYTAIKRAITDNGFNVRAARIDASGILRLHGESWRFHISGTGDSFVVVPDSPVVAGQLKTLGDKPVVIRGTLPPPEAAAIPQPLRVQSVEAQKK